MPTKLTVLKAATQAIEANDGKASLAAIRKHMKAEAPDVDAGARLLATLKKAVDEGNLVQPTKASYAIPVVAQAQPKKAAAKSAKAPKPSSPPPPPAAKESNSSARCSAKKSVNVPAPAPAATVPTNAVDAVSGVRNEESEALAIGESVEVCSSSGMSFYLVSREGPNEWFCTCPARKFAKKDKATGERPDCKHILEIKAFEATGEKPEDVIPAPAAVRAASGKTSADLASKPAGADGEGGGGTISFSGLKIPQLKDLLRHNDQLVGGNKADLLARVVECYEHGCLPRCPECGVGRLKLTGASGSRLTCPGGYDDDQYVRCFYSVAADGIARPVFQFPDSFSLGDGE